MTISDLKVSVGRNGKEYTISGEKDFILACALLNEHKVKLATPVQFTLGDLVTTYYDESKGNFCDELKSDLRRLIEHGPFSHGDCPNNKIFYWEKHGISFFTARAYGEPNEILHITQYPLDHMWSKVVDIGSWDKSNTPQDVLEWILMDYDQFYKPKHIRLGLLVHKYYHELKDDLCDKLQLQLEELMEKPTNQINKEYEICDCGPMGILCYSYYYPRRNFYSVQAEPLDVTWNMFVDIENWQKEALPAKFEKNTVCEKQVLKYILSEYNSVYTSTKFFRLGEYAFCCTDGAVPVA